MAHRDQIRALMPDLINGKTHQQLREEMVARDEGLGVHYVDGVKLPWVVPKSNLDVLKSFEVRDNDVFVVSFPRSGKISPFLTVHIPNSLPTYQSC